MRLLRRFHPGVPTSHNHVMWQKKLDGLLDTTPSQHCWLSPLNRRESRRQPEHAGDETMNWLPSAGRKCSSVRLWHASVLIHLDARPMTRESTRFGSSIRSPMKSRSCAQQCSRALPRQSTAIAVVGRTMSHSLSARQCTLTSIVELRQLCRRRA